MCVCVRWVCVCVCTVSVCVCVCVPMCACMHVFCVSFAWGAHNTNETQNTCMHVHTGTHTHRTRTQINENVGICNWFSTPSQQLRSHQGNKLDKLIPQLFFFVVRLNKNYSKVGLGLIFLEILNTVAYSLLYSSTLHFILTSLGFCFKENKAVVQKKKSHVQNLQQTRSTHSCTPPCWDWVSEWDHYKCDTLSTTLELCSNSLWQQLQQDWKLCIPLS